MADDIPQWAKERAVQLANAAGYGAHYHTDDIGCVGWGAVTALAKHIAEYERPPVDPVSEAARATLAEAGLSDPDWSGAPDEARKVAAIFSAELAKRGLTITASDASASVQSPESVDAAPGRKGE